MRRSFQGAPLVLALAFACAVAPTAAMMPGRPHADRVLPSSVRTGALDPGSYMACSPSSDADRPVPTALAPRKRAFSVPLADPSDVLETSDVSSSEASADLACRHITALVLRVQRQPMHCALPSRRSLHCHILVGFC